MHTEGWVLRVVAGLIEVVEARVIEVAGVVRSQDVERSELSGKSGAERGLAAQRLRRTSAGIEKIRDAKLKDQSPHIKT